MTPERVVVDSSSWIEVFTDGGQAEHFLALMAEAPTARKDDVPAAVQAAIN